MPIETRKSAAAKGLPNVALPLFPDDKEAFNDTMIKIQDTLARQDAEAENSAQDESEVDNVPAAVSEVDMTSNAPSRSSGRSQKSSASGFSVSSKASRMSRKRFDAEKRLALIAEEERRENLRLEEENVKLIEEQLHLQQRLLDQKAKANAERCAEARRLVERQLEIDLEEDDEDKRSNVLSVESEKLDVAEWAKSTRKTTKGEEVNNNTDLDGSAPVPIKATSKFDFPSRVPAQTDKAESICAEDPDVFKKMADAIVMGITAGMKTAQAVPPQSDVKTLLSRQISGAKDLPEFHGNPEDWPLCWNRFETSTEMCGISPKENIIRLQKCLKGNAKDAVYSMLTSDCSLNEIIEVLKENFGRPDQVVKKMLGKARNTPPPSEGDFTSLVTFSNAVRNFCATAESMKLPIYLENPILVEEFQKKLPHQLQMAWGEYLVENEKTPDLRKLSTFLRKKATAANLVCQDPVNRPKPKKENCFVITDLTCPLKCTHSHSLDNCRKFKKKTVDEKWELVKGLRVCFVCLEKGHQISKCPKKKKCEVDGCEKYHHQILHNPKWKDKAVKDGKKREEEEDRVNFTGSIHERKRCRGMLKVVPVEITGPKGTLIVNAFLDDGCSVTMIEEEIANKLGLEGKREGLHLSWLGGKSERDTNSRAVSLKIRGLEETEVFDVDNVCTKNGLELPVAPVSTIKKLQQLDHLKDVPFPNVLPRRPSLIIGGDNAYLLLARKAVEGARNAPMASWTYLGWALHGPKECGFKATYPSMLCLDKLDPDEALHELVKEQFRLESLGVINCPKVRQSKENQRACDLMEKHSRKVGDRWETALLWKNDEFTLPSSKPVAYRRLMTLEKQHDKDPAQTELYEKKIEEYMEKEFCRKLTPEEVQLDNGRLWYIPHFGRVNPNKPGKIRLVFDAAAKVNGISLNDMLLQGPDLMSPLINVLLNFRQREIAFSGDIRDMFHRVLMRQEDSHSLRFLWRGKDRSRPPDVYAMNVMIFGAIGSPFQAQWIKNKNAEEYEEKFPEAVKAIKEFHYVDDYLDSCETVEDAIQRIMQVRDIHRRGGFEIRGWLCNDQDVLKVVAPEEVEEKSTLDVQEDKLERVLGLHWDPKVDCFKFKTNFRNVDPKIVTGEKIPSKRELLSLIMSLFDPLGFITHLTVRGRMLLQDVWKSGIGWDEKLKPEQEEKWRSLLSQILKIPEASIGRCYAPKISKASDVQLHVFCDASQQAFSAVAYLRVTDADGNVTSNIVMAKSRVAPIKCVSIPRLEMEAALIGARMANFIRKNLSLKISSVHMWTDSKNVLCWIRADDPTKFKIYISHRITEILELTEVWNWRWVPTAENVADDATRDYCPADVSENSRWFQGPDFLKKIDEEWPKETSMKPGITVSDLELKKDCCLVITEDDIVAPLLQKYSEWMKLIRVTAWILRFKNNAKPAEGGRISHQCLMVKESRKAEELWIKIVQKECFQEELEAIGKRKPIRKTSKLSKLSPILKNGILCVDSRLANSPHLMEGEFPVILDGNHRWTKLLITWYHVLFNHHGIELICNELRQKYWIIGLKNAVRRAARECITCQEEGARRVVPEMAALPSFRVTRPPRPFTYVGVDYFGPIEVVNGRKHEKRYGLLFTCLSVRAVHLEMANSLSTDDFIMALMRFINRRGEPKEIWSDNGTNFRGAESELKKAINELDQSKIEDKLAIREIQWHFIPPGAPHMGGAWERMVKSVKTAMYATVKNRTLNDQLLTTLLTEAEVIVNSRPLTAVSSDKDDPTSITLNCFLFGTTSVKQMPGNFKDMSYRKRWRQAQFLAECFWRRWIKEYLPSLALRAKWNKKTPDAAVGEIVFIPDLNEHRNRWTKGIIEDIFPGDDGRVRVVDVRTVKGKIRRPVAMLYRILPIE